MGQGRLAVVRDGGRGTAPSASWGKWAASTSPSSSRSRSPRLTTSTRSPAGTCSSTAARTWSTRCRYPSPSVGTREPLLQRARLGFEPARLGQQLPVLHAGRGVGLAGGPRRRSRQRRQPHHLGEQVGDLAGVGAPAAARSPPRGRRRRSPAAARSRAAAGRRRGTRPRSGRPRRRPRGRRGGPTRASARGRGRRCARSGRGDRARPTPGARPRPRGSSGPRPPSAPIRRQRSTSSSEFWKPASKPPDRLEGLAADQHAGGGDRLQRPRAVDGGVVAGQAGVEVVRVAVLAEDDAGVLDGRRSGRPAWRRPPPPPAARVGVADQRLQPAGPRLGVVVEEDEQLAARRRRARVAGGGEADVLAPAAATRIRLAEGAQHLRRLVGGGVVDDDDLAPRPAGRRGPASRQRRSAPRCRGPG